MVSCSCTHFFFLFFFLSSLLLSTLNSYEVGGFTPSDLLDKPWSQVGVVPPRVRYVPSFFGRAYEGFSIPTARRFSSNALMIILLRVVLMQVLCSYESTRYTYGMPLILLMNLRMVVLLSSKIFAGIEAAPHRKHACPRWTVGFGYRHSRKLTFEVLEQTRTPIKPQAVACKANLLHKSAADTAPQTTRERGGIKYLDF